MKGVSLAMALLSISGYVSGCDSAQADWTKASSNNTVVAYESFLSAHPKSPHAFEARAMILQINDDTEWQGAQYAGTRSAYETYLRQFPRGSHVTAANEDVTAIDRSAAWKSARQTGTVAALKDFLRAYPTGPEVAQAKAELRGLTDYRAHLATETNFERARRKKDQLKALLNDPSVQFAITPSGTVTSFSVDAINMTEQAANSTCDSFKGNRQTCRVIKD